MKQCVSALAAAAVCLTLASGVFADKKDEAKKDEKVGPALNFTMDSLDGKPVKLSEYQGKVVLMVNVASRCGLTKQYDALEDLHEKYHEKGLAVLGFPANEFGKQEPGTNLEIAEFCKSTYDVKFPMFSKVVVKKVEDGDAPCDLYKYLTKHETKYVMPKDKDNKDKFAGDITWNFEKFLVNKKGEVVARFAPQVAPEDPRVIKAIEAELAKN